jgi:hypothetical protein
MQAKDPRVEVQAKDQQLIEVTKEERSYDLDNDWHKRYESMVYFPQRGQE